MVRLKGFILKVQKAKNEDIIVTILSQNSVKKYYRFYGARHSILQLGYLIDFETEESGTYMPQVRRVSHIGFDWLYNREKLMLWHRFISIFEPHFRDINEIEPFYYESLLKAAKRWNKQSAKRLIVETYINILKYEGRVLPLSTCVLCKQKIENSISVIDGFLPTHSSCSHTESVEYKAIKRLFEEATTIDLDDNTIDRLYLIALKGFLI